MSRVTLNTLIADLAPDSRETLYGALGAIDSELIDRAIICDDWTDALERLLASRDIETLTLRDLAIEFYDEAPQLSRPTDSPSRGTRGSVPSMTEETRTRDHLSHDKLVDRLTSSPGPHAHPPDHERSHSGL